MSGVLVTGSSGHLGDALVRRLTGECRIVGLDLTPSYTTSHEGSVDDPELVAECMRDVSVVYHTATLHKPHVATHSRQQFVDTNISGTLTLLEAALRAGVNAFIFTSTTSAFGGNLKPPAGEPAAWITEQMPSVPKNIYGATKTAAEDLCHLFQRRFGLPCLALRTSRFFPEEDDSREIRESYEDANAKANEYLHRRVDIADIVDAHLLAAEKAPELDFERLIISATTPFLKEDLELLRRDAPAVLKRRIPAFEAIYQELGWKMFPTLDRVYVNERARSILGWRPKYSFETVLKALAEGRDPRSELARTVGSKGYHDQSFDEGPYPVETE
ncbi:MAG: NAD(P)-dependent oxidoreductase [Pseudomonadota bacterium]